jgi:hypothetical protein
MRKPPERYLSSTGLAARCLITSTCTLFAVMAVGALRLAAQPPNQSGLLAVTVTDPANRFVTGLVGENFVILESGTPRPVTYFSIVDSPNSLAIVSESPLPVDDNLKRPQDELIQTSSLSDALRQLVPSKNQRKAVIVTTAAEISGVPAGIQVVQADPSNVFKLAIELRNQYLLRFQPFDPAARIEVMLKPPRGLPALKTAWKPQF